VRRTTNTHVILRKELNVILRSRPKAGVSKDRRKQRRLVPSFETAAHKRVRPPQDDVEFVFAPHIDAP
jgi:hypothetical protein